MGWRVVWIMVGVVACHSTDPAPAPPTPTVMPAAPTAPAQDANPSPRDAMSTDALALAWSITPRGDALHVEYTVTNHGSSSLWLVDDMLTWKPGVLARVPSAIVVRAGSRPGVASLFRGQNYIPTHDERQYPPPGIREVPPGGSVTGSAETALPLRAWDNYHPDKIAPLPAPATAAELELQYLIGPVPERDFAMQHLDDGTQVKTPTMRALNEHGHVLRGEAKPVSTP